MVLDVNYPDVPPDRQSLGACGPRRPAAGTPGSWPRRDFPQRDHAPPQQSTPAIAVLRLSLYGARFA